MYTKIIEEMRNKTILILGFGMEGKSSYNFIREHLPDKYITIADINIDLKANNPFLENDNNVSLVLGENYLNNLKQYEMIIKSPGICIKNLNITDFQDAITSQVELFLKYYGDNTIGVTGTKGKSTTSSLIYNVLSDQNYDVRLLGNIGVPIFEYIKEINNKTIVVLELSSDQLTYANNSPHISIWLNVFQEHLDHYNSYQEYIDAKANINKYQKTDDYFIYNNDNQDLLDNIKNPFCQAYSFSLTNSHKNKNNYIFLDNNYLCMNKNNEVAKLFNVDEPRKIMGTHNLNNIMAVLCIASILNLDIEKATKSIKEFKTLPHRLEYLGNYNDVDYYDDSISTIPESCISAIQAIENVDTIIIGGKDRGVDYTKLVTYLKENKIINVICMPDTGYIVADKLNKGNCIKVSDLEEAVKVAVKLTKKGKACVLSPAASSYGFFKNYIERGNEFQRLIKILN